MNRILIEPGEMDGDRVVLRDRRAAHVVSVIGARPGDSLKIGVIDGPAGEGEVVSAEHGSVVLRCRWGAVPPRPSVDLILAVPRPKVLGRLWPQLAALGVGRIVLVNAAKVERPYFSTHWLQPSVYRPLLIEGLEQSGDTWLPVVSVERLFRPFVEDRLENDFRHHARVVLDPSAPDHMMRAKVRWNGPLVMAVGPDGGWTRFELDMLSARGFAAASLGVRVLRTETACVVALAMANAVCDGGGGIGAGP